jgi:hypothetical protein
MAGVALGEPTDASSSAARPASVPGDYVVTPNGYFHPSCVHRIDRGETLEPGGVITRADGTSRRVAACRFPHYASDGAEVARNEVPALPTVPPQTDVINGWVAYASYVVPRARSAWYVAADMSVPEEPTLHSGQTIYFFPGLEDLQNVQTIVQPVLGWNAFNDNRWTMASWNCCMDGQTWHSAPIAVAAGVTLEGEATGTNCSDAVCDDWAIVTRDPSNGHETTLNTSGFNQAFDWVFGAVLEVYGVSQCGHYPATGSIEFSQFAARYPRIPHPRLAIEKHDWDITLVPRSPDCGYQVTPHPNPDSRQITIEY